MKKSIFAGAIIVAAFMIVSIAFGWPWSPKEEREPADIAGKVKVSGPKILSSPFSSSIMGKLTAVDIDCLSAKAVYGDTQTALNEKVRVCNQMESKRLESENELAIMFRLIEMRIDQDLVSAPINIRTFVLNLIDRWKQAAQAAYEAALHAYGQKRHECVFQGDSLEDLRYVDGQALREVCQKCDASALGDIDCSELAL